MANSAITRQVTLPEASVTESQLAVGATLKLGTEQASTSGTAITFTGIPAGTKQIIVMFEGVSTNGSGDVSVQLGDAGGIETSGYVGTADNQSSGGGSVESNTDGIYMVRTSDATFLHTGVFTLVLKDAANNTWTGYYVGGSTGTVTIAWGAGSKSLTAVLDRVSIQTRAGDTFDAGSINIAYK